MLLGHKEAEDKEYGADNRDHCDNRGPLHGIGVADSFNHLTGGVSGADDGFLKEPEYSHGDETSDVGEEHPERGEHALLLRIGCNYSQHGSVRNIHGSVGGHHKDVSHVSVKMLDSIGSVRDIEGHDADQSERNRQPEKIRAIFTPPGLGAVGYNTHHGVGNGVVKARDSQQGSRMDRLQAEHVRIKNRKVIREYLPEHRGRHVP